MIQWARWKLTAQCPTIILKTANRRQSKSIWQTTRNTVRVERLSSGDREREQRCESAAYKRYAAFFC